MLDPWINPVADTRVVWLRLHGRGRHDPTNVTDLTWAWRTYAEAAAPVMHTGFI